MYTREYVVQGFIKLLLVCSEEPHVVGDLPALPYCFGCSKFLEVDGVRVCYSEELTLPSGVTVVVSGTEVLGELRSVSFVARNVTCDVDPGSLLRAVEDYIMSTCSKL
ncbi:MAG: hypothetical protein LM571_01150 [Desulfurococcaceae archaeon]|jgi:hypothetical protein|nr:hypothetical protein [Desulfurococcaceae archaeon]